MHNIATSRPLVFGRPARAVPFRLHRACRSNATTGATAHPRGCWAGPSGCSVWRGEARERCCWLRSEFDEKRAGQSATPPPREIS
jgi:hypothetical protein